jgi:hypothetical protein
MTQSKVARSGMLMAAFCGTYAENASGATARALPLRSAQKIRLS